MPMQPTLFMLFVVILLAVSLVVFTFVEVPCRAFLKRSFQSKPAKALT
jgi:peptidoglycan/LPS O-acetylase OafA/YrhL